MYYGFGSGTKLDVPTYSDGTHVYVSLEAFMQALGGTYETADGKVTVSIDVDALPALIAELVPAEVAPETGWEYLDYYFTVN